ncbi:MAG: derlin [Lachnospiraceae bacterium]|nr:derlin [Lachnospiraceae bacterium]
MSWFEKKFGKYAIKNLSLIIVACYAVGYLIRPIMIGDQSLLYYLMLDPESIIDRFQIWRLFTWVFIPSGSGNVFLELILLYFFYMISKSVETAWGTYRYNVYIFSGMLFTVVSAFLLYGFYYYKAFATGSFEGLVMMKTIGMYYTTYYITLSIFLALAATFPDNYILVFFIIPMKMKALGIIYVVLLGYNVFECVAQGLFAPVFVMFASLLNFIIFFIVQRKNFSRGFFKRPQGPRFQSRSYSGPKPEDFARGKSENITRHKCAICGQTEKTSPELSFRFCSKCNGNYEYCENHLFTHTHIQ